MAGGNKALLNSVEFSEDDIKRIRNFKKFESQLKRCYFRGYS